MSLIKKGLAFLWGFIVLGQRVASIEKHVVVMNEEMGRLDVRQDKQGEDLAYIRGRIDAG